MKTSSAHPMRPALSAAPVSARWYLAFAGVKNGHTRPSRRDPVPLA